MSKRTAVARANNGALSKAKAAKQDEFYTQLVDIEYYMKHYRPHLRGKVVLYNCDYTYERNFFKYFALNFNEFNLKKIIATSYGVYPFRIGKA
jgi:hypothetical protein